MDEEFLTLVWIDQDWYTNKSQLQLAKHSLFLFTLDEQDSISLLQCPLGIILMQNLVNYL